MDIDYTRGYITVPFTQSETLICYAVLTGTFKHTLHYHFTGNNIGVSSRFKGYYCGGNFKNTTQKIILVLEYSTETLLPSRHYLNNSRSGAISTSTRYKGYVTGGICSDSYLNSLESINFASDYTQVEGASIQHSFGFGIGNYDNGYYCGGNNNLMLCIDGQKIDYHTATLSTCNIKLTARTAGASNCNLNKGYFSGGMCKSFLHDIESFVFATESCNSINARLVEPRSVSVGIDSVNKGLIIGGYGSNGSSSEIDGINFTTETMINHANVLGNVSRNSTAVDTHLNFI